MRIALATIAALALAGCFGVPESGPGGGAVTPGTEPVPVVPDPNTPLPPGNAGEAKGLFDTNVAPIMEAKCSGAGCHTGTAAFPPPFLGTGPLTEYYDALVADIAVNGNFKVENARLLAKLAGGAHAGQTYSQQDVTAISEWLNSELAVRNPGETPGGVPPAPAVDALAQWVGCMNIQDWNQTNMGNWANKNAEGNDCANCHGGGLARFNTNPTNQTMFEANRFEIFAGGFFAVQVNLETGENEIIPATEKLIYMGGGQAGNLHPRYNVNLDDQDFQNLQAFYDLTKARVDEPGNPRCGLAQFPEGAPPQ